MLALARAKNQEWLIGPDITITLLKTSIGINQRGYVKLKIEAPIAPHSNCGTCVREGDYWIVEHVRLDRFYIGSNGFQVVRSGDLSAKLKFNIADDVVVSRGELRWLHLKLLNGTATAEDMQAAKGTNTNQRAA